MPAPLSTVIVMLHITHLEHTAGHDKFWQLASDGRWARVSWGRRGTVGQSKEFTGADIGLVHDRLWEKEQKGYRTVLDLTVPVNPGADQATILAALTAEMDRELTGVTHLAAVADYPTLARVRPWTVTLTDRPHAIDDASGTWVGAVGPRTVHLLTRFGVDTSLIAAVPVTDIEQLTIIAALVDMTGDVDQLDRLATIAHGLTVG